MKNSLPPERSSITRKFKIGDLKGYITVGLYSDGRPGEVFFVIKHIGSLERGVFDALGLIVSSALQRGIEMKEITEKLKGIQFDPSGLTGDPEIPVVSSIIDYVAKWLELRFVTQKE